jgi:hypothetical protein
MRVRTRLSRVAIVGACCAGLGGGLATAGVLTASAFPPPPTSCVVNAITDEFNAGVGTCDSTLGAGKVTLRSAIEAFNNTGGPLTITFAASTNGAPILLTNGKLVILRTTGESLTITGNGMGTTVVDAQHLSRLLSIGATGNVPDVTLNNMTFENGQAALTGGIHVEDRTLGTLNLNGMKLTGDVVNGGHVDAASVLAATLNISGSLITGDQSTASTVGGDGVNDGEIVADGALTTITNTSVTNNTVVSASGNANNGLLDVNSITAVGSHLDGNTLTAPGAGRVDGIFDSGIAVIKDSSIDNNIISGRSSNGVLDTNNIDIERTSISGNSVTVGDLGTSNAIIWPSSTNTVVDTTISGNSYSIGRSATLRGFVYEAGEGESLTFTNNTVAKNTLSLGPGAQVVGGTFDINGGTANVSNVILSGNTPSNCNGTALPGGSTSHSLDSDSSCGIGTSSGNLSGVDPKLGPLQVNAPGATQTMAIDQTSPAYNTADNATCPTVDQRGVTRLFAGDNLCDMGAFEFVPPPPVVAVQPVAPTLPAAGRISGGQPGALPGALVLLLAGAAALSAGVRLRARRGNPRG